MEEYRDRTVVGLYEPITIISPKGKRRRLLARIDTGATKSSIDRNIVEELKLGPIIYQSRTRQASGLTERPVIRVRCILHDREFNMPFTVANRGEMKYKILIGQNILKKGFLIDPLKAREKVQ